VGGRRGEAGLEGEGAGDGLRPRAARERRGLEHAGERGGAPRPGIFVVERRLISKALGYDFHRGCAAAAPRPAPRLGPPAGDALVFAIGLSDPSNLGALLRNALALGASGALIERRGADPLEPRALRASAGAAFRLPWTFVDDVPKALEELRARGLALLAATLSERSTSLVGFDPPKRFAILVGNEGYGLPPEICERVDRELTIPMTPGADSLNVAASSAVFLYALLHSPQS